MLEAGKIYKWPEPCNQNWRFYCVAVVDDKAYGWGLNQPKWKDNTQAFPEIYWYAKDRNFIEVPFNVEEFNELHRDYEE